MLSKIHERKYLIQEIFMRYWNIVEAQYWTYTFITDQNLLSIFIIFNFFLNKLLLCYNTHSYRKAQLLWKHIVKKIRNYSLNKDHVRFLLNFIFTVVMVKLKSRFFFFNNLDNFIPQHYYKDLTSIISKHRTYLNVFSLKCLTRKMSLHAYFVK